MMDSDHTRMNSMETIRQELISLKEDGRTKRRRRLGELEQRQQVYDELNRKYTKTRRKQPLSPYSQELTDSNHLIPQRILGIQAKLAQCLHLMEVYLQQKSLIEKQHRAYAQLLAQQAGQEEEEQGDVTRELLNNLCKLDTEVHEWKQKLKEMGCDVDDTNEEETLGKEPVQEQPHDKKTNDTHDTFLQQQDKKNPWWWPIQHGDDKQKPPLSHITTTTRTAIADGDAKSISSETSSLMDLLWMPAKFKSQATASSPKPQQQDDSLPVTTVAIAKHENVSPSGSTHSSLEDESSLILEQQNKQAPVMARQWWPTMSDKHDTTTTSVPEEEQEEEDENPQHWWESFYRS